MHRSLYLERIRKAFKTHPVVALLGPRQSGKTTLANDYIQHESPDFVKRNYFDLERNTDLARLKTPQLSLEGLKNLIVIDEIQRIPELFPTIRVLAPVGWVERFMRNPTFFCFANSIFYKY